jgi:hypothetical protein
MTSKEAGSPGASGHITKSKTANAPCSAPSPATVGTLHPSSPLSSAREAEPEGQQRPREKESLASSTKGRLWRSVNVEESRSKPQGLMTPKQKHRHFCDVAGHCWECEGYALRTFSGRTSWTKCICVCGLGMTAGDHCDCPIELLPCPRHFAASLIGGSERDTLPDPQRFTNASRLGALSSCSRSGAVAHGSLTPPYCICSRLL